MPGHLTPTDEARLRVALGIVAPVPRLAPSAEVFYTVLLRFCTRYLLVDDFSEMAPIELYLSDRRYWPQGDSFVLRMDTVNPVSGLTGWDEWEEHVSFGVGAAIPNVQLSHMVSTCEYVAKLRATPSGTPSATTANARAAPSSGAGPSNVVSANRPRERKRRFGRR